MPALWEYPPMPHDYPYYWFISDPKLIKYGKNVSRVVDFFLKVKAEKLEKLKF